MPKDNSVRTNFYPKKDGYQFENDFVNNFISELDVRTSGLCGGMVYSALDYFNSKVPIPGQNYPPAEGSKLRDYIYDRQVTSIQSNIDKWIELFFNPFGIRDEEFWRWGLDGKRGGRIWELRQRIDKGKPVPISLLGYRKSNSMGDHQVLAIGYKMGRYKGDLGSYKKDFTIYIYDPNRKNYIRQLKVDIKKKSYYLSDCPQCYWRTYFVDLSYKSKKPPAIFGPQKQLITVLRTGKDDLRGGRDNLNIALLYKDGKSDMFRNVNKGRRWINKSTNAVSLPIPQNRKFSDIRGMKLSTTFSGGLSGDNWNLHSLNIYRQGANGKELIYSKRGRPLKRFTGSSKTFRVVK